MFRTRVISSVVLVILALVTILGGGYLLAATLLFLALVAYRELMKACKLEWGRKEAFGTRNQWLHRNPCLLSGDGICTGPDLPVSGGGIDSHWVYVYLCIFVPKIPF